MINKYTLIKKIICFFVFLVVASSLFGQSQFKVAIFPVINDTDLPYIDALSDTAEDNIHFMMTQLENYNLVDERDADLPSFKINDLRNAAKGKNCDYIIYGSISGKNPFTLSLFLFERGSNKIIAKRVGTLQRMTEVFNVSDKLALALLEDLTGEQIRRGELHVINNGAPGSFVVSINNRKLDVGVSSILLMKGKYKIKIEGINDINKKRKTLYSEKIIIEEGGQTPVEFILPVWGKGTLSFKNVGTNTEANYTVNIDGDVQEANISAKLIETGRHKIEIFDAEQKNKKIYSKRITVKEGIDTNVPFKINAPELGTITFINKGKAGTFDVTLDGQNLGQNIKKTTAVKGSHNIEIYELTNGKRTKVLSKKVTVKNKGISPIKFKLKGTPSTAKKPVKKKPTKTNKRLNTKLLRVTVGGTFLQEASFDKMELAQGNIKGGDIAYLKLGYSGCNNSGVGFTIAGSVGVGGFWEDLDLYQVESNSIDDGSYSPDIFLGFDLGLYFRTKVLGFAPVLTFGYNSGSFSDTDIYHYIFGINLGIDIFISPKVPITLEIGVVGGWAENSVNDSWGPQVENFDIAGLTIGVGIGINF